MKERRAGIALYRRGFLEALLAAGCGATTAESDGAGACLSDEPALGRIPFLDEGAQDLDVPVGEGLDGRLYTDLGQLDEGSLVVPNARFYVRTRTPDRIDYTKGWRIAVDGLVARPASFAAAELDARGRSLGVTLLECSGNARGGSFGLMSAAEWSGVPLRTLLDEVGADPGARVLVSGFDEHSRPSERSIPGASWIFSRADIESTGALLATRMNGEPLPRDHGFPVRLVVPGWYGCTCIKWVDTIRLVGDGEPSTPHMREFASRTHQDGEPPLARDYRPASIQLAAFPVRIERLARGRLRFTGIQWGGDDERPELDLVISSRAAVPVDVCVPRATRTTWGLWTATVDPLPSGTYDVTLISRRRNVPTRRLDTQYYRRSFAI